MIVTLSDPAVEIRGWLPAMDALGSYTMKRRRTPEEIEERKRLFPNARPARKLVSEVHTVLSRPDKDDPSRVLVMPGLWPRIRQWLDEHSFRYDLVDKRNMEIRPDPDYTRLKGTQFRPGQAETLAQIVSSDCGIVSANVGWGKSYLMAKLCKIYPTLNIVVTTNSKTLVDQLYKDIADENPGEVGILTGARDTGHGKRIIVATVQSLEKIPPAKVHLLLVDECHFVGAGTFSQVIGRFIFARRFGFSATAIRNDGTGLVMESLLGPVIMTSTYQESVANGTVVPIQYTMIPCSHCPPFLLNPGLPDHIINQYGYWRNNARNAKIAQFVKNLLNEGYDGQILITVSTTEPAIALHQMLPWFVVAHAGHLNKERLCEKFRKQDPSFDATKYDHKPKDVERMLGAFAKGTLKHMIATKIVKQGINLKHLTCLIRADATKSQIDCFQIPGRLSRLDNGKSCAYLIDLYDTFSPWAIARSKARRKEYERYGWQEVGIREILDALIGTNSERAGAAWVTAIEQDRPESAGGQTQ